MAGWLSRATSLFQQPLPPPEPFEVECDCGGKVTGQRTNVHQRPACPRCERPVFVLPANAYPQPKLKPKAPPKPVRPFESKKKSGRASVNDVTDDNPQALLDPKSSPTGGAPSNRGAKAAAAEPVLLQEPRSPIFTPLRLVTLAIVVMSGLTIAALWHRSRIEYAKATVAKSTDAARQALQDRDYATAALEFERARQAVDILGRTDETANSIRQSSRESTALANLSTSTLTECLEDTLGNSSSKMTESVRMSSAIQGAWVIFDSNLSADSRAKNLCVLDAPVILKNGKVQIEIESPRIRSAVELSNSGESPRVIFAAQLESLSAYQGDPATAVLTLNGKTAFCWTSYDTYYSIGYRPIDPESEHLTRTLLESQSREK